ncbi:MAG: hypothetical protein IPP10_10480 [Candidatus Competibacteraceae bacterium]|nr:hypothetical protein [Candidatus Competibacteraceae bacterium]MBK9951919.1 hypothetical protein [Candidatus Competibacteraceae bacterium]
MIRRLRGGSQNRQPFFAEAILPILLGAALVFLATLPTQSHAETKMAEMTEAQLKARVADRYKALFAALYFQNPVDHAYAPMPAVSAEDFKVTGETDAVWTVAHDPLVGVIVRASVSKATGLVQFDTVDIAVE